MPASDNGPMITVEMFPFREGDSVLQIAPRQGLTLGDLIDSLDLPGSTEAVIVNGAHVRPDYLLRDGDHVRVIRFMSGG